MIQIFNIFPPNEISGRYTASLVYVPLARFPKWLKYEHCIDRSDFLKNRILPGSHQRGWHSTSSRYLTANVFSYVLRIKMKNGCHYLLWVLGTMANENFKSGLREHNGWKINADPTLKRVKIKCLFFAS